MIKNIFSTIDKYNKYHSPEATAKLVKWGKNSFLIEFSGPFCRSCGISDWFDDFKIELEKKGLKIDVSNIKEEDESYLVKFSFKRGE